MTWNTKVKVTGKPPNVGNTQNVEIIVPLKYLSNFWRTFEVSFILTWSSTCVISFATGETKILKN